MPDNKQISCRGLTLAKEIRFRYWNLWYYDPVCGKLNISISYINKGGRRETCQIFFTPSLSIKKSIIHNQSHQPALRVAMLRHQGQDIFNQMLGQCMYFLNKLIIRISEKESAYYEKILFSNRRGFQRLNMKRVCNCKQQKKCIANFNIMLPHFSLAIPDLKQKTFRNRHQRNPGPIVQIGFSSGSTSSLSVKQGCLSAKEWKMEVAMEISQDSH